MATLSGVQHCCPRLGAGHPFIEGIFIQGMTQGNISIGRRGKIAPAYMLRQLKSTFEP